MAKSKYAYWEQFIKRYCDEHGTDRFEKAAVAEWAIRAGLWLPPAVDAVKVAAEEIHSFLKAYKDGNGIEYMINIELEQKFLWADRRRIDRWFRQQHLIQEAARVKQHKDKLEKKFQVMLAEQPADEEPLQLTFNFDGGEDASEESA